MHGANLLRLYRSPQLHFPVLSNLNLYRLLGIRKGDTIFGSLIKIAIMARVMTTMVRSNILRRVFNPKAPDRTSMQRRWAHEQPVYFYSCVIGAIGPLMAITVPPIRRRMGYKEPQSIPVSYPRAYYFSVRPEKVELDVWC